MRQLSVICLLVLGIAAIQASPKKDALIPRAEMPAAALAAFEKAYSNVQAIAYEKDVEDGQIRFEIKTKVGEFDKDFVFLEDGTLLLIEEGVSPDVLPAAVLAAIKKVHPGCEMEEAEKITRGSRIEYEVVVEVDEREFELVVSAEGKIMADQPIDDEESNPGDKDTLDEEESERWE